MSESASRREVRQIWRVSPSPCLSLSLSPLGAALLGRDDGAWPRDPEPAPLHVVPVLEPLDDTPADAVIVDAPNALPLVDRFALEGIVAPDPENPGRYALTGESFQQALQRGHGVEGVVNFLERASGEPLPAPVLDALYRWEADFDRVTIRRTILLQTQDSDQLRELTGHRRIREILGRTLNERTVVLSVPARHIQNHASIIHQDDYDRALKLLIAVVEKLDEETVAGLIP